MSKNGEIQKYLEEKILNKLKATVDEIENGSEFIEWQNKGEIEQYAKQNPELSHFFKEGKFVDFCHICESNFSEAEKIISKTNPILFEFNLFHEECFRFYSKNLNKKPDQLTSNSHKWPKNICAFCELSFDEDLTFTDGDGYFCEERAPGIPGVYKI